MPTTARLELAVFPIRRPCTSRRFCETRPCPCCQALDQCFKRVSRPAVMRELHVQKTCLWMASVWPGRVTAENDPAFRSNEPCRMSHADRPCPLRPGPREPGSPRNFLRGHAALSCPCHRVIQRRVSKAICAILCARTVEESHASGFPRTDG